MGVRQVLAGLRDGIPPGPAALRRFAAALASGQADDMQAGAFAMGVCRVPLDGSARVALTEAMRDSGQVLAWDLPGPVVDKHSTGGIGDCTSLLLAPALAATGAYVPMISGRGLGHTGGTLDKLEAIPGLSTGVGEAVFRRIVADIGTAIVSASASLAPADRRLYAVRDVTSTVESIDLITASILAKKLAAGIETLVLDVKTGSGAFMSSRQQADTLADTLVTTANGAGCRTSALISDMNQPLAPAAGNAVELAEVMLALEGRSGNSRLVDLTAALGGEALTASGLAHDAKAGADLVRRVLADGRAAEIFGRMVAALGGPPDFVGKWRRYLPAAPVRRDVFLPEAGVVTRIDGRKLGEAVVQLGGGRLMAGQDIDPSVGLSELAPLGADVGPQRPVAHIHAASTDAADAARAAVRRAYGIGPGPAVIPPLICKRVAP